MMSRSTGRNTNSRPDGSSVGQIGGLIGYCNKVVRAVFLKITRQRVGRLLRLAVDGTEIEFSDLVVLDLFVHHAKRFGVLCRDHDATRVSVDSVAERRGKGLLLLGIVLTLLIQIRLDVHDQGVLFCTVILMHEHTGALVAQNDIVVLIDDVKLGRDTG